MTQTPPEQQLSEIHDLLCGIGLAKNFYDTPIKAAKAAVKMVETLRETLSNPPPDIQGLVLKKRGVLGYCDEGKATTVIIDTIQYEELERLREKEKIPHKSLIEELHEVLRKAGADRGEDPHSIQICSPISEDEGWVAKLVWHHHDGNIREGYAKGKDLEELREVALKMVERHFEPQESGPPEEA